MNPHQIAQRFQMIQQTVTKACWWFAVNFVVCVVIITNPLLGLLILALLRQRNSLDLVSTLASHNGVPVAVHLQEELCIDIANEIMAATASKDVGVYIQATHGCCENRGIMAHSSLTQTTVLRGAFKTDDSVKKEFMDNIKLQQEFAPR
jgi:hypothetical protein